MKLLAIFVALAFGQNDTTPQPTTVPDVTTPSEAPTTPSPSPTTPEPAPTPKPEVPKGKREKFFLIYQNNFRNQSSL